MYKVQDSLQQRYMENHDCIISLTGEVLDPKTLNPPLLIEVPVRTKTRK